MADRFSLAAMCGGAQVRDEVGRVVAFVGTERDQAFLGHLRAKVATVRKPVAANHRQRHVMLHTGDRPCGKKVPTFSPSSGGEDRPAYHYDQTPATSMIAWAKALGSSWGRLWPIPPSIWRCSYRPVNLLA